MVRIAAGAARVSAELSDAENQLRHFAQNGIFTCDRSGFISNDKSYRITNSGYLLLAYLDSSLAWFFIVGLFPAVRGGFHEMRGHYIERVP